MDLVQVLQRPERLGAADTSAAADNLLRLSAAAGEAAAVELDSAARQWRTDGYVILPGFVPAAELKPALDELPAMYPSADGFHDGTDERRDRFTVDEWAGIDSFPFPSTELSLLAVSDRVIDLAETLLADRDLRISSAEAWAKYTGAADYDQPLHRDYLNHTLMVPADDPRFRQLEMFVYLVDVPEGLGPPSVLSRTRTTGLPVKPNWYPRAGAADSEWGQRMSWPMRSHEVEWYRFAHRATPRQLALFGFPLPGHPYWTESTIAGTAQRYPGLDMSPWRQALRGKA
jgi:hypothetical protein